MRKSLGLDDPVPVQFVRYFGNAAQFKFGVSYQFRQPVATLLMERMPATLELAICATVFAMVFGILMGVYSALKRDTGLAKLFQTVSLIGISLPTFLIGILLIYLFAVTLGWLPSFGRGEVVKLGWWTHGAPHAVGPEGADHAVDHARPVPDDADHAAGARRNAGGAAHRLHPFRPRPGLTTRAIHFGHALKNTLVPVITVAGLQFGSVIAFAIITETVFQWPGMGLLFVQAVQNVDIPIMAAYLLMVVADLRHHQSGRRYPLHRGRSAPALDHQPGRHERGRHVRRSTSDQQPRTRRRAAPSRLSRMLDSDIFYSFRRSSLRWWRRPSRCCFSCSRSSPGCSRCRTRSIPRSCN